MFQIQKSLHKLTLKKPLNQFKCLISCSEMVINQAGFKRTKIDICLFINNFAYRMYFLLPYSRKVWQEESLANLANQKQFAKLKPSKFLLTIITFWLNLFIRQTFFTKCSKQANSPNFTSTKVSCYTVY